VLTEMIFVSSSEAVSYLRLIDTCITQLQAQGPSRPCDESKEEDEKNLLLKDVSFAAGADRNDIRGTPVMLSSADAGRCDT